MAKNAIVTGASGGIGRAVAKRLADDGFAVVVNYAGNAARADDVVAEITAAGGRAVSVQADVASAPDVARLFKQAGDAFGKSDVVVHCAGIMPLRPIADGDLDMFDKVIATNLRGAFVVLAEAARQVPSGGRIIAFSTSVIAKAFPGYGAYIASKAGVEGLVHVLANELRGRNISVNAVAPGPVATDLFLAGKTRGADRAAEQGPAARAARSAGGHIGSGLVSGRPGWGMGQWSDPARQRRFCLTENSVARSPAS
jgi:3-oxoacyl-[acyl-carrier protein] reductase